MLHESTFMFSDMVFAMNTYIQPCLGAPHRPSETVTALSSLCYPWHRAACPGCVSMSGMEVSSGGEWL